MKHFTSILTTLVIFLFLMNTENLSAQSKTSDSSAYHEFLRKYPNFSKENIESISFRNVTSKNKSITTILSVKAKRAKNLQAIPPAFNININEETVTVYDNGVYPDQKAGDGVYSCLGHVKPGGTPMPDSKYTLNDNQFELASLPNGTIADVHLHCHIIFTTNCPNCKGFIFGGPCIFCCGTVCTVDIDTTWGTIYN